MKSLLSTKEINDIEIFKFFTLFSKIWKIRVIKRADRIGDRAEPCSISIFALKGGKIKLFHK